jgi:hypothetical protein
MKFRMSRNLRFWVDVEYQAVKNEDSDRTKSELIAQILCEFEEAGTHAVLGSQGESSLEGDPQDAQQAGGRQTRRQG